MDRLQSAAEAEQYLRAGAWQDRCLYDILDRIAADDPEKEAICDQSQRLTYGALVAQSNAFAQFLVESGVRSGDCVALQCTNRAELLVIHMACNRADATFLPLSHIWRKRELLHLLSRSRAVIFIVPPAGADHEFLSEAQSMRRELPNLRLVASLDGMGDFVVRDVLGKSCARVAVNTDANAARYVMVTSGTTSLPKMSLWTDNNLWYFGKTWTEAVAMSFKDRAVGLAPAGTGSVGYVYAVLFPVLKGATSIIQEIWSPSAALVLLKRERATHVTAVPTQLVKMLRELGAASIDLPSLRAVTSGGATMPPEFAKRLEETWNCRIQTVYGSTDGGVALMTRLEDPKEMRHVTVGRALPLTDVKVIAENGQSVNAGDTGEIVWRGPSKTFGYLNEAERTQEAFAVGGYFRSGDLGTMDSDGYVRIVGRAKDIIIRGGQNISPRELEEAIGLHPSVAESAVVGLPDTVYGERICAVVALRAGAALDLAQLVAFLTRSGIARFKLPERLEIVGSLPTNAAGKVSKADVRDLVRRLSMNAYDA